MSNASFADFDSLMNASMDDIDDLPPVGVPPTGHYNLLVTASRETSEASGNEYIKFQYEIQDINEIKNEAEASEAAVGQKFSTMYSPFKKDGSINEYGIGFLKEAVKPYAAHFGTTGIGDTLAAIQQVSVAATLVRRQDKKDPERMNFNVKDVVVL